MTDMLRHVTRCKKCVWKYTLLLDGFSPITRQGWIESVRRRYYAHTMYEHGAEIDIMTGLRV